MRDPTWVKIDLTGKAVCAVVGPQNCGKSTLVKYLVNRLRSSETCTPQTKLCVLDVDCGQPTYSLPGTIALHQVSTKSCQSVKPELVTLREVFMNSANPALDPETYLDVITELLEVFQSLTGSSKKLIVNTCGWVDGLGAEI